MARTRRTPAVSTVENPPIPTPSLVASAVRYPGNKARIYSPQRPWQAEAYRHYGICGEARYAAQFYANSLSRATLYAAVPNAEGGGYQRSGGRAQAELERIFGPDTSTQTLAAIGLHLTIGGECYIVGREHRVPDFDADLESTGEVWEVISALEMKVNGREWSIDYGNGRPPVVLTEDDLVIRVWRPHPERRIEADSPFRSLLPVLNEIEWLTRHIFQQTQSRLTGAGVWFLPQGLTFPPPPDIEGQQVEHNEATAFMMTLAEAMMAAKADADSPAGAVPICVTVPDDVYEKIDAGKLIQFWSNLDEKALEMRASAVHRFALGMDLPPEQIEGMSSNPGTGGGNSNGVSHWGAWQIDESTIKVHIEPVLELICSAVTVGFLRSALGGSATDLVRYDTSSRSKEALELYDRGLVKAEVVLRENRFDPEEDAMDAEERKTWLLVKIASGSATPEQVQAALGALGVTLPIAPPAIEQGPMRESRPAPSLEDHETREPPQRAAAMLPACEALVLRGLERAGNRLRSACKDGAPKVPAHETHSLVPVKDPDYLLDDAWGTAHHVLDERAEAVVPLLDSYCRMLFAQQEPHSRERLAKWLETAL
jgi:hypothetical protein